MFHVLIEGGLTFMCMAEEVRGGGGGGDMGRCCFGVRLDGGI
jgi:hypothetical protein